MKKCLTCLAIIFMFGCVSGQDNINGFTQNYNEAVSAAQNEKKILMVDFWASWCGPCKKLDKEVYSSAEFRPYTQRIVCVKVDFESKEGKELAKKMEIGSLPTVVFLNHDLSEIERIRSYFPKADYIKEVERIIAGENTIPNMERKYQTAKSYATSYQLAYYFGRKKFDHQKFMKYYEDFKAFDPSNTKDSTLLLKNVVLQEQLENKREFLLKETEEFLFAAPARFQLNTAIKLTEYYLDKGDTENAKLFFLKFYDVTKEKDDKDVKKLYKKIKEIQ